MCEKCTRLCESCSRLCARVCLCAGVSLCGCVCGGGVVRRLQARRRHGQARRFCHLPRSAWVARGPSLESVPRTDVYQGMYKFAPIDCDSRSDPLRPSTQAENRPRHQPLRRPANPSAVPPTPPPSRQPLRPPANPSALPACAASAPRRLDPHGEASVAHVGAAAGGAGGLGGGRRRGAGRSSSSGSRRCSRRRA